jgi:hypothetical protein
MGDQQLAVHQMSVRLKAARPLPQGIKQRMRMFVFDEAHDSPSFGIAAVRQDITDPSFEY